MCRTVASARQTTRGDACARQCSSSSQEPRSSPPPRAPSRRTASQTRAASRGGRDPRPDARRHGLRARVLRDARLAELLPDREPLHGVPRGRPATRVRDVRRDGRPGTPRVAADDVIDSARGGTDVAPCSDGASRRGCLDTRPSRTRLTPSASAGTSEKEVVKGEGPTFPFAGDRWYAVGSFNALTKESLKMSQNQAHGDSGACYVRADVRRRLADEGDVVVAMTSTGDNPCYSTNVSADRTSRRRARSSRGTGLAPGDVVGRSPRRTPAARRLGEVRADMLDTSRARHDGVQPMTLEQPLETAPPRTLADVAEAHLDDVYGYLAYLTRDRGHGRGSRRARRSRRRCASGSGSTRRAEPPAPGCSASPDDGARLVPRGVRAPEARGGGSPSRAGRRGRSSRGSRPRSRRRSRR